MKILFLNTRLQRHAQRSLHCILTCLFAWVFSTAFSFNVGAVVIPQASSQDFAHINTPIAGVAGGKNVVFVGKPLDGQVVVLSRATGQQIGVLPPPAQGFFAVPLIIHSLDDTHIAVLAAGGIPQPAPFQPADPVIYEYEYTGSNAQDFSATLVRTVNFTFAFIGFAEDFVRLNDGRYLVSDAILGSIWIANTDDTVTMGIGPKTFSPADFIPKLALCPSMPEITVNGYPFLFTGSTLPGVSPLAVRDNKVYYHSSCARGIYSFPVSILADSRQPYQRASDIRLVVPTANDVAVEELLDFSFNPYQPKDRYLYAANPLKLQIIRINLINGKREVVAEGAALFDFPSSLGFLPPLNNDTPDNYSRLVVVSNQQERSPLTNDAVTETTFNLPFIVAKVFVKK